LQIPKKKRATRQLQAFLTRIASEEVLSFDQAAAERAGRIEGELERVGRPIGRADPMIAAIAWQNGLELVTGNTAHYQWIQQIGSPLVLHDRRV
jgi:tRNA(fMet)-specific endonuclease VapC